MALLFYSILMDTLSVRHVEPVDNYTIKNGGGGGGGGGGLLLQLN